MSILSIAVITLAVVLTALHIYGAFQEKREADAEADALQDDKK